VKPLKCQLCVHLAAWISPKGILPLAHAQSGENIFPDPFSGVAIGTP
jgi:hypothetical protein